MRLKRDCELKSVNINMAMKENNMALDYSKLWKLYDENKTYKEDLRVILDKLVGFNQNFKNTYESLLGKIE